MITIKTIVLTLVLLGAASFGLIYSGFYSVGADVPHNKLTYWLLDTMRERSVQHAAKSIHLPDLSDPSLLLAGGPDYNEMCAGCHLKPGITQSDLSIGLYPRPPNLALLSDGHDHQHESIDPGRLARHHFWIIKHGIKASGMPSWGLTHDDQRIWAMVAFLRKLPELTPDQYQILTARDPEDSLHHSH